MGAAATGTIHVHEQDSSTGPARQPTGRVYIASEPSRPRAVLVVVVSCLSRAHTHRTVHAPRSRQPRRPRQYLTAPRARLAYTTTLSTDRDTRPVPAPSAVFRVYSALYSQLPRTRVPTDDRSRRSRCPLRRGSPRARWPLPVSAEASEERPERPSKTGGRCRLTRGPAHRGRTRAAHTRPGMFCLVYSVPTASIMLHCPFDFLVRNVNPLIAYRCTS